MKIPENNQMRKKIALRVLQDITIPFLLRSLYTVFSFTMEIQWTIIFSLLLLALPVAHAYTDAELTDMLKDGFRNVMKETINAPVTIENGTIPNWLSGLYFMEYFVTADGVPKFHSCTFLFIVL